MASDGLRYDRMVEDALRGVVRAALKASENGLPGDHHFYVTFRTGYPGVTIPDHLRARFPEEMTIVLQHQFWGLEVEEERFGVTLSFNRINERLTIPFAAVTAFADPSAKFGLQFPLGAQAATAAVESIVRDTAPEQPGASAKPINQSTPEPAPEAAPEPASDRGGEEKGRVIALDAFRKK